MRKQFLAGSNYFFKQYTDYQKHDIDYIVLNDDMPLDYWHFYDDIQQIDWFYWKINTPKWHIEYLLKPNSFALDVAHLLIPEVAHDLGITIKDLDRLQPIIEQIVPQVGPEYHYYELIYQFYLQNNGFWLTQEQLDTVYNDYKKYRGRYHESNSCL